MGLRRWVLLSAALLPGIGAAAPTAGEAADGAALTWRRIGPGGGGWMQAIAREPCDPAVIYAGSGGNRVFIGRDVAAAPR